MLFQDDEGKFKGLWNRNSSFEIVFEVVAAADIDSDGINFWKGISGPEQLHKQTNLSPRAQLSAWLFLLLLIIKKEKVIYWSSYKQRLLQRPCLSSSVSFFYGSLFPLVSTKGTEGRSSETDAVAQRGHDTENTALCGCLGVNFPNTQPYQCPQGNGLRVSLGQDSALYRAHSLDRYL